MKNFKANLEIFSFLKTSDYILGGEKKVNFFCLFNLPIISHRKTSLLQSLAGRFLYLSNLVIIVSLFKST